MLLFENLLLKIPLKLIPFPIIKSNLFHLDNFFHGSINILEFVHAHSFVKDLLDGLSEVYLILFSDYHALKFVRFCDDAELWTHEECLHHLCLILIQILKMESSSWISRWHLLHDFFGLFWSLLIVMIFDIKHVFLFGLLFRFEFYILIQSDQHFAHFFFFKVVCFCELAFI